MNKILHANTRRIVVLVLFLLSSVVGWTQVYQNGVRKGMVKVKFSQAMATSLGQVQVNAKSSGLTTGIQSIDAVAKNAKATNMYRLFPYDAKYENKLRKHGLHLWYVVEIDENVDPKTAVRQFKQLKEVTVAEVEHEKIIKPYAVKPYTPGITTYDVLPFNDPLLKDQWHYDNRGQTGISDADVNLFEAWTQTTGSNNIIVSVHDEGVDVNHNDLKSNIWTNTAELNGVPNVDDDGNGFVDDINGFNFEKNKGAIDPQYHGTHVAGTIAAVNNNGVGVSGIAGGNGSGNGVKIMSLQILGGAPIEKSFVYAANNGAVISQNSWGYSSPGFFDQSILDAISYFVEEAGDYPGSPMKGGIVIFAAGNSNYDGEWYPGYFNKTLAVASIGPDWKKASYSNYGAWVEISAPGGEMDLGSKNGVLSTIPNNQYAYLQGTSMACPHVSGIAALALANRTTQLTNDELWNKLVTGVVPIDQHNPDYVGLMGSGAIDASLAIQNDLGIAPLSIADVAVTGIAQEFATLTWTVPADTDDGQPVSFQLYHHNQPITSGNLASATKTTLKNALAAGEQFSYELDSLLGLTIYHFAVTSTDRWGNVSVLSNVVSETTNQGPSIAVDENSQTIALEIDAAVSTSATHDITILNEASGILRWNHFMRHSNTSLSFSAVGLNYPVATKKKTTTSKVAMRNSTYNVEAEKLRSTEPEASAFTAIEKAYTSWPTNIIGETDLELTNSAAAKFYVSEASGFNLTQVRMYLKHDPALGPVIMEVYKGAAPTKSNLVYAQEHNNWSADESWAYITLNEQLYFESGSTFWVAFHVPAGNLFPLGIGYENDPAYSTYCFMSFDMGTTWVPLETALNNEDFAWSISADSYNEHLGTYLTLEPGSGDVNGNEQALTTLTANAATLINGNYNANLIIASNDAQKQELRIPVSLTVSGHKPNIKHIDIADYGSVFQGTEKTLELVFENVGYGNFNDPIFSIDNPEFSIVGWAPWQIKAREEVVVGIKFSPTGTGNTNGILTITNGDQTYQVSLFGVGAETSQITITPESQVVNNVTIGDVVNAQVTVENTGAYPLKYFIPGYDGAGISENWPSDYHSYGYKFRSNYGSESAPIDYEFQDISATGVNITESLMDDGVYYTLDMGFEFPYYGQNMQTLYIAQKGFTTFDNSVRPINTPSFPGNEWSPKGIISPLGGYFSYLTQGEIFYQVEADRVIVQYDNVWDGWNPESITAQMVLYANGDIRFFYENMGYTESNQSGLSIFIEDLNQSDGILIHEWDHETELYSGLALGFDYPGPNIITNVTNGSGILAPGSSAVVDIELSTASLVEGTTKRYVNFISNDPAHAQSSALIQLEITDGGTPQPLVSVDTIAFGDVFQGAVRSTLFTIKNPGNANVEIASMNLVNEEFNYDGEIPATVKPGLYKIYTIEIPTDILATFEDWLSINYADGSHDTIYITGKVVEPPAINVDLSLLQETLAHGETSSHPFSIESTGLSPLEVVVTGKQWLTFEAPTAPVSNTYVFEKHNTGGVYQWIDIRETGTQLPFVDFEDWDNTFWRTLELPFPIEFYGVQYTSFKIGDNGIISFEDEPQASFFTDYIPSQMHSGPCIMPYWTFSGFSDYLYPIEDIGIFYKSYDDKFIITWSYFTNNFGGMGDPVSAQVIFYKNGTMKFQYKREEGGADLTSHFGTIGLQKDSNTGVAISEYLQLDHGDGLAYIVVPAENYVIAPGATLTGEIKIDAQNIYGGQYNENLVIQTNVPGSENLVKPVELTVTGEAVLTTLEEVDFGRKMIQFDGWSPMTHYVDMNISNTGSAPLEITWAQMAEGTQGLSLQVWALVDGWFGPEWRWADISELYSPWAWITPVFTVNPGDVLKARATFAPSFAGDFVDELVLTSNLGETRIPMIGTGYEPPVLTVDMTPVDVVMNTMTETTTRSIAFDNLNGLSDLEYEVSIDFGRATTSRMATETLATDAASLSSLQLQQADVSNNGAQTMAVYNRILTHTDKDVPDTYVGTGGSAPFTLATKYNAGPQGFNLSHVETWFKPEDLAQGSINVEIRAGGTSIADAVLLTEGSIEFNNPSGDNAGDWYAIAMNQPAGIYPNEDFYVVVTYPLGIQFPQGSVTGQETVIGRYYYYDQGLWYNVQEVPGFETVGWLMYAAEETAGNSSWLSITSSLIGTVGMGEAGSVELLIEGAFSKRGDQVANIVLKSNDPNNGMVSVPVTLHVNEAPHFNGVPESIVMAEKDTLEVNIEVVDLEDNTFTIVPAQVYPGVTHTFNEGTLTLILTPDYGDEGNYVYSFTATDEHNAVSELALSVEVMHTNQAPVYIGTEEAITYSSTDELTEYAIADFFSDPDGDVFTFIVGSLHDEIADVFASADKFIVKTNAVGETSLVFTVTDSYGAITKDTVEVVVDAVSGIEDRDINFSISTYPNPVREKLAIHIEGEINSHYHVRVFNMLGISAMEINNIPSQQMYTELDLSNLPRGIYFVEITDRSGKSTRRIVKE
jgi:subtilisin family serine protease